jgi:hypothetical protein
MRFLSGVVGRGNRLPLRHRTLGMSEDGLTGRLPSILGTFHLSLRKRTRLVCIDKVPQRFLGSLFANH